MVYKENNTGREGITVKLVGKVCGTYQGLGGTFATFVDCCLRKKSLAGFHENGLIADAELKGNTLELVLAGKRTQAKLAEIMDIALQNIGAYPETGVDAAFFIGVKSEK